MGKEFFAKGANVQLGPGLCVARVPRNGRDFEYLSGEDPFLGYTLVKPVITGIQGQSTATTSAMPKRNLPRLLWKAMRINPLVFREINL
jgi:beta-glucosidase-like glycosyl hydrolase